MLITKNPHQNKHVKQVLLKCVTLTMSPTVLEDVKCKGENVNAMIRADSFVSMTFSITYDLYKTCFHHTVYSMSLPI